MLGIGVNKAALPRPQLRSRAWAFKLSLPKAHWTPHYVVSRTRRAMFEYQSPEAPWLARGMVAFLEEWLKPSDLVVEFGSGRSTVWFARRVAQVISCEHDAAWHGVVSQTIREQDLSNVQYHLPEDTPEAYLAPVRALPTGGANLVLVDGRYRDVCAVWAAKHVRRGGLVVVDNANWFLPHATRSPDSVGADGTPASEAWAEFAALTRDWRCFWVSDGVTDTACWFS